jgi:GAF domain-containing protein/uncharacterized membrane protein
MYELGFDLAAFLFFLAFLVFILRQKKKYFEYHPYSWRALILGAILLVLAGGTNLAFDLSQEGYASTSQSQQSLAVMGILGYLAGGVLILIGLVTWYSSLGWAKKNAYQRLRQLACLKSILSVINHRRELDEILKDSLSNLVKVMGYKMGVIFKPTFQSSEMVLAAHQGVPVKSLFALYGLYFRNMWYRESRNTQKVTTTKEVESLPEFGTLFSDREGIRSFACVPIKFCGKVLGLMGLYDTKPECFSYQEIQFLTGLGEVLGLTIRQSLVSERNKRRRDYISAIENMLQINQEANSLEEAFPKITTEFKRIIDFDHISLVLAPAPGQDMKRISMGSSGGLLVERRTDVFTAGMTEKVMRSKEVWIDRDIDLSEASSLDPLVKACGIRSRIIFPVQSGELIRGAFSLGHKKPNFYSAHDVKWLGLLAQGLSHLLLEQNHKEKLEREISLGRSLHEFEKKLAGEEDLKALLQDATTSLSKDLPKSFARVTLLSKEKNQLINCSAHQIRSQGIDLKKKERFPLNDLPWHRLTLEAKRPMLINQDDPEGLMSKEEARLIMDEKINSAFLVPLILNEKAVGILAVGEMRSWDRQPFTEEEKAFVKRKANQLSLALKKSILHRSNELLKERLKNSSPPKGVVENQIDSSLDLSDLSYQINNPLTSIRGSAELLMLKESNLSPESLRYLANIEKGVDRIQKTLQGLLSSATESRKSGLNQPSEQVVSG